MALDEAEAIAGEEPVTAAGGPANPGGPESACIATRNAGMPGTPPPHGPDPHPTLHHSQCGGDVHALLKLHHQRHQLPGPCGNIALRVLRSAPYAHLLASHDPAGAATLAERGLLRPQPRFYVPGSVLVMPAAAEAAGAEPQAAAPDASAGGAAEAAEPEAFNAAGVSVSQPQSLEALPDAAPTPGGAAPALEATQTSPTSGEANTGANSGAAVSLGSRRRKRKHPMPSPVTAEASTTGPGHQTLAPAARPPRPAPTPPQPQSPQARRLAGAVVSAAAGEQQQQPSAAAAASASAALSVLPSAAPATSMAECSPRARVCDSAAGPTPAAAALLSAALPPLQLQQPSDAVAAAAAAETAAAPHGCAAAQQPGRAERCDLDAAAPGGGGASLAPSAAGAVSREDSVAEDGEAGHLSKRARMVWSAELHARFMQGVRELGLSRAVPKAILSYLGVDDLTRENVASHLQKYRLHLKRLAGVGPNDSLPDDRAEAVQDAAIREHHEKMALQQQQQQQQLLRGDLGVAQPGAAAAVSAAAVAAAAAAAASTPGAMLQAMQGAMLGLGPHAALAAMLMQQTGGHSLGALGQVHNPLGGGLPGMQHGLLGLQALLPGTPMAQPALQLGLAAAASGLRALPHMGWLGGMAGPNGVMLPGLGGAGVAYQQQLRAAAAASAHLAAQFSSQLAHAQGGASQAQAAPMPAGLPLQGVDAHLMQAMLAPLGQAQQCMLPPQAAALHAMLQQQQHQQQQQQQSAQHAHAQLLLELQQQSAHTANPVPPWPTAPNA